MCATPLSSRSPSRIRTVAGILFGIGGPVLFAHLEYNTHCLSGCLFDPVPTPWHLAALLSVSVANASVLLARSGNDWITRAMVLFRWPALIVPLYYFIAIGPFALALALIMSPTVPFALGKLVLDGFAWPTSGPDRLEAESRVNSLLIILPALMAIGWICLKPWGKTFANTLSDARQRHLAILGATMAIVGLILMERPSVTAYFAVCDYTSGRTKGTVPQALQRDDAVASIARLLQSPPQFSSDGPLDCEGPVDVFGPTVHILNKWASPTEMWVRFTVPHRPSIGELLTQISTSSPSIDTSPRSWRGLSPWELRDVQLRSTAEKPD